MKLNKKITEILGWYGTLAIVSAYLMVNFKIIAVDNLIYQLLNLTGALGLVKDTLSKGDNQPATLNIFWALIAFIAIIRTVIS